MFINKPNFQWGFQLFQVKCLVGNAGNCSLFSRISPLWPMPSPSLEFGYYNVFTTICSKEQTKESKIGVWSLFTSTVLLIYYWEELILLPPSSFSFAVSFKWPEHVLLGQMVQAPSHIKLLPMDQRLWKLCSFAGYMCLFMEGKLTNWSEKKFPFFFVVHWSMFTFQPCYSIHLWGTIIAVFWRQKLWLIKKNNLLCFLFKLYFVGQLLWETNHWKGFAVFRVS